MSYLAALRLHFAGRFQARTPTSNNDPDFFDPGGTKTDFGYNRYGDGTWRLLGAAVTGAFHADGRAAAGDPVLKLRVADSDRGYAAKLVDLDVDQQLVSTIYGLDVRLCDDADINLLRGRFKPAALADLWLDRNPRAGDDAAMGAYFQSVLTDLEWGATTSPWLKELRAAAEAAGALSIKFNLDSYVMDLKAADLYTGRIVGTIGVAAPDEPRHLLRGRRLIRPKGSLLNHALAVVDETAGKVRLDLGNSLPIAAKDGPPALAGKLSLSCGGVPLGAIDCSPAKWYELTAGIVDLPPDRTLGAAELEAVQSNPLELTLSDPVAGTTRTALHERASGLYLRCDTVVFRLSPGDEAEVMVYATRFGRPLAGATVVGNFDISWLSARFPSINEPRSALAFSEILTTDAAGRARAKLVASDPGVPRPHLDGQIYGVRYELEALLGQPDRFPDPSEVLSVRVWGIPRAEDPVTWAGTVEPIFARFKKQFPVPAHRFDLVDPEHFSAWRNVIARLLKLDLNDPHHMPVSRDLSPARRNLILRWLASLPPPSAKFLAKFGPEALHAKPPELAPFTPKPGETLGRGKAAALAATTRPP